MTELGLVEEIEDEVVDELARVERLDVDMEMGAEAARLAQEVAKMAGRVVLAATGRGASTSR